MLYTRWFKFVSAGVLSAGLVAGQQAATAEYRQLESQADNSAFMRAYKEAESLYLKAVEAAARTVGAQHPDAGRILSRLALMNELQDRPDAAEPLYQKAIGILEASPAAAPADRAAALELYGGFLQKQQRGMEADDYRERARPIRARLVRERVAQVQTPPGKAPAVRIAKGMQPPTLVSKVEPKYSDVARMAKYQGTVVLKIEVGVEGTVQNIELSRGLGFGLDEQAVDAVLQWKFNPAIIDGQPVAVQATIEINFRLL